MQYLNIRHVCLALSMTLVASCANTQEGESARRGAKYGAAGGALVGLALGAATGSGKVAAAGAVAGAAAGAGAGAMYEYDQSRQDRRTQTLADSIGGAKKGETVDDAGKRHLDDFIGDWNLDIWVLSEDGKKITAKGKAKGVLEAKTKAKIEYQEIKVDGYDDIVTGSSILGYDPQSGFSLENTFSVSGETLKFVGEYVPDGNKYNYYLSGSEGKTVTGIVRSNVRVEVRISSSNLWVAETFTLIDGKEVKIQSYRFMKA
ncbi:hypothetical protein [Kaarinaea lacus]